MVYKEQELKDKDKLCEVHCVYLVYIFEIIYMYVYVIYIYTHIIFCDCI